MNKEQASEAYIKGKLKDHQEYLGCEERRRMKLIQSDMYKVQKAFEDGWEEAKKQSENKSSLQLTRDYFANHNWEIIIPEPDENGFILWEARWIRSMEKGSPYYSDLTVTNMMYEDRFCISGKTGEASVEWLMAYTEEDLENILKALAIYDYYKKENENV